MKIIAYGIRDDETPYLEEWATRHPEVSVAKETELLDETSVAKTAGYDGVVAYQQKPYTATVLDRLASNGVKVLSLRNVGVDNIDRQAVKRNHLRVTNVPAYSPAAIAELAVTDMMRLLRHSKRFESKQRQGDLTWAPDIAEEMNQQTVGIYATGRIGRTVVQIVQGFGARVIAYDPYPNAELQKAGIYVETPDELFAQSDILTLHAPALAANDHLIDDEAIAKMKPGIKIINAARGSLIDTDALIRGLDSGQVSGAALDVYEDEVGIFNTKFANFDAIPDDRLKNLMQRDNVLVTPHVAFYTKVAVKNMVQYALDANLSILTTGASDKEVQL
ncbi:D-lactate dehydrogenase [Fructilactobacillus florum 8D]|uniref:D-lactate dehydrogenase n=1 Tax=Fructilactobacillus florum 8D TaxID=1221538 RepID=W9EF84_9LACO|nr:D-2-hydroxyacid dehydrogenase [Fructilactobacillus florum]EKK20591.1 D-lactate dehydrogenase [Fructilactobacillus florum 2F]ETO40803.1 D-lactate dehydrogenase [Fructilactobacillus florum 8D]